ncbi:hypothetical protein BJ741DRAFT_645379 [Chytriomyces cf. hyalinus JEL632]|nr:hypothetical protein BJ741DRAFT_645379 [Chytriomyces cf. hyalinus JEL632]
MSPHNPSRVLKVKQDRCEEGEKASSRQWNIRILSLENHLLKLYPASNTANNNKTALQEWNIAAAHATRLTQYKNRSVSGEYFKVTFHNKSVWLFEAKEASDAVAWIQGIHAASVRAAETQLAQHPKEIRRLRLEMTRLVGDGSVLSGLCIQQLTLERQIRIASLSTKAEALQEEVEAFKAYLSAISAHKEPNVVCESAHSRTWSDESKALTWNTLSQTSVSANNPDPLRCRQQFGAISRSNLERNFTPCTARSTDCSVSSCTEKSKAHAAQKSVSIGSMEAQESPDALETTDAVVSHSDEAAATSFTRQIQSIVLRKVSGSVRTISTGACSTTSGVPNQQKESFHASFQLHHSGRSSVMAASLRSTSGPISAVTESELQFKDPKYANSSQSFDETISGLHRNVVEPLSIPSPLQTGNVSVFQQELKTALANQLKTFEPMLPPTKLENTTAEPLLPTDQSTLRFSPAILPNGNAMPAAVQNTPASCLTDAIQQIKLRKVSDSRQREMAYYPFPPTAMKPIHRPQPRLSRLQTSEVTLQEELKSEAGESIVAVDAEILETEQESVSCLAKQIASVKLKSVGLNRK